MLPLLNMLASLHTQLANTHLPSQKHAQIAGHFLLGIPPADYPCAFVLLGIILGFVSNMQVIFLNVFLLELKLKICIFSLWIWT